MLDHEALHNSGEMLVAALNAPGALKIGLGHVCQKRFLNLVWNGLGHVLESPQVWVARLSFKQPRTPYKRPFGILFQQIGCWTKVCLDD